MRQAEGQIATWKSYGRLWVYLRPYTGRLALVVIVSLAATCLGLLQPYVSKLLIDEALMRNDLRALCIIAGLMFFVTVMGFGLNILASYRYVRVSAAMLFDMRLALFRHLQRLSPRFYTSYRLGDLMSRLNNDISEVQRVSADTALSVLSNIVFLAGSVGLMLWLNWRLFFVSVVLLPACLYAFIHYQKRLVGLTKQMRERSADLGSLFVDTILGMRVVLSMNAQEHEAQRFRRRNDAFVGTMLKVQMVSFLSGALPGTILAASTATVFLYGGWLIVTGKMTIGTLVAFMAYHGRLLSPIQNLMGMTSNLASARVSLGRIFELMDTRAEVEEKRDSKPLSWIMHSIRFENVSMRHDRALVLDNVSFDIPAGGFCAILGPSGAGKSTMADLLVRYLDPDRGRILIDGVDLRELSIKDLRREVILVDQAPFLFNATIAENIAYAMPTASQEEIEGAGRDAGLEKFLARLPDGYATKTGERGLALSAGERQRVALARALIRRPSVLILDEPTSALDAETERIVAEGLRNRVIGTTLIVITHRPALAETADIVITMQDRSAQVTYAKRSFETAAAV